MRTSGAGMARALIVVAEETPAAFPAGNSDLESSGCLAAIGGGISRCKMWTNHTVRAPQYKKSSMIQPLGRNIGAKHRYGILARL
jgi:hypothetical protein